jgi:hypothetical protein
MELHPALWTTSNWVVGLLKGPKTSFDTSGHVSVQNLKVKIPNFFSIY